MERFGITVGSQLLEVIRFAGVGVLLGLWYDLFRLLRLLTRPPARRIFVEDLLFFAGAAAATLLLALPISSGRIRLFHLLALTVGFICYYHTVGRLLYRIARLLVGLLERLAMLAQRFSSGVAAVGRRLWQKRPRFVERIWKKVQKNVRNRLKLDRKV